MDTMQRISGVSKSGCTVIALAAALKIASTGLDVLYISNSIIVEDIEQEGIFLLNEEQADHSHCLAKFPFVFIDLGYEPSQAFADKICNQCQDADIISVY